MVAQEGTDDVSYPISVLGRQLTTCLRVRQRSQALLRLPTRPELLVDDGTAALIPVIAGG